MKILDQINIENIQKLKRNVTLLKYVDMHFHWYFIWKDLCKTTEKKHTSVKYVILHFHRSPV